jgi:hypothetical protein
MENPRKTIFASVLTNFRITPESPKTGKKNFGTWLNKSYAAWINPRRCALPTTFGEYFCSRSIFEDIEQYRKVRHQNLSGSKRPDFITA